MSSSDPTSNLESLNISSESMDVPAVVGEASQRSSRSASSTPRRARSKTTQGGGSGRKPVSTIMKALPRASQSRGPSPSHRGQGSVGVDIPVEVHHHQEFHVHDDRTQTVTMGVDPVEYGRMVGEAQRLLDESKSRADHFEGLSKEIYSQACQQVQQLMSIAQQLHQSCIEKDDSLQRLSFEVQRVKVQLQDQISINHDVMAQFDSAKSQTQMLLGHKDSEISRLMSEVSNLSSDKTRLEERLAALSAAPSSGPAPTQAPRNSGEAESHGLSLHDVQAAVSSQLAPVLEAFQELSGRMMSYENNMSRNYTETPQPSQPPQARLTLPVPLQGPRQSNLVGGTVDPPGGDDPGWGNDDDDEDEEELIVDPTPKTERDMVDGRALQHAKLDVIPSNASEFRAWKNSIILLFGRLDISEEDVLTKWLAQSFQIGCETVVQESSGQFPRLDRWLAAELIKGLKQLPELQFKVQGYIESCTREATAPRGRAILHMISRHFDLDRHRGALLTSQSVFQIDLPGYAVKDLQEFSSQIMKTLNAIPSQDWPSKRMLGEFLFHKLRTVRRLERVIDEIKI